MPRFGLLIASGLLAAGALGVGAGTLIAAKTPLSPPLATRSARPADELAASSACQASLVRYEWNKRAGGAPWISTQVGRSRLEGYLLGYHEYLGDGRVNRSESVVLRAGKAEKIAWFSTVWGGSRLTVTGKRLDGRGTFSQLFRAAMRPSGLYPSAIRIPTAGCWRLTLRTDGLLYRVVVKAVDPAPPYTCNPAPVQAPGSWVDLAPARSGISAAWSWRTAEGGALLYTGGRTPDGGNTKVLWRARQPGGQLVLSGSEIGGTETFRATFNEAGSPPGYWPSRVVVPTPGCWLLTARGIGKAAGIVVVRVVSS
jgi:hypothetical protein